MMPHMTNAQWRASRVNGKALDVEGDPFLRRKITESLPADRLYPARNDWVIMRDPGYSCGAWLWIAERTTRGKVELRGFDQLSHARAWCAKTEEVT